MAISTMLIKAKYGDMIRRFHVQIIDKEISLNIFELKAKILSLFNIGTKADLILTYIDEDGDAITMNDDDDLRDVVMQGLNPLRITVKVDPSSESEIQRLLEAISKNQNIQAQMKPNDPQIMDHINFLDSLMEYEVSLSKCLAQSKCLVQSTSTSTEVPLSTSTASKTKDFNSNTSADTIDNNKKSDKISECNYSSEEASLVCLSELIPYLPSQNGTMWSVVHNGVSCNGCGANPITGPRFKSTVEENYNLCRICYLKSGNATSYVEIGNAVDHWPPISLQGLYSRQANVAESSKARLGIGKLDSCFVGDVTIVDETVMDPLTRFTKIWRMENTGTLAWPQKTQVVWTGGDRLSNQFMVKVKEIPETGLPIGQQIAVGVDFVAPERPGRYISHWRLASPSGTLFGAHIWVHIKVSVLKEEAIPCESICGLNLNFPPLINPYYSGSGYGYGYDYGYGYGYGYGGYGGGSANYSPIIMQYDTQLAKPLEHKQPNDAQTLLVGGSTSNSCSTVPSSHPIQVSASNEKVTPCDNICGLNLNFPPLSNPPLSNAYPAYGCVPLSSPPLSNPYPYPGYGYGNYHPIIMQHDTQFVSKPLEHKQPSEETSLVGGSTSNSGSAVASSYPVEDLTEVVTSPPPFVARFSSQTSEQEVLKED